jgi:6-phospho-beta-glucosidase
VSHRRIVMVGGGSRYALGLCDSLIDYARDMLPGTTVVLLDVREERLGIVHEYASKLTAAVGADIAFEQTTDRRRAFDGADFILNTFRPGSQQQQEQDESIPPKYGLQGNETVGIGGIFMCCRVVPVLRGICADAQELCPNAWMVNYTNPTNYVADAVRRISDVKIISLCDGYVEVAEDLAPLLEVEPADITVYPAGVNHSYWIMRFTVNGEDGYPMLAERLAHMTWEDVEALYAPPSDGRIPIRGNTYRYDQVYHQFIRRYRFPFSLRLYKTFGLLPAPRFYWRYHLDQDAIIAEQRSGHYVTMAGFCMRHLVADIFARLPERLERASQDLRTPRREGGGGHGDLAVRLMSAIANDLGEVFAVNVPNRGAVCNLPPESILEVAATVDRTGTHPFTLGPMPKELLGYQHSLLLSQELAVDAALSGNRNDLLKAIVAHPLIHSLDAAEKAMDELLHLQAEWLPQFR